jgi:hypothetical protein
MDSDKACTATFDATTAGKISLHRLFHPGVIDHLYTTNPDEVEAAKSLGYLDEGVSGYVYASQVQGTVALHRLFHPGVSDHLYTTNPNEVESAKQLGYLYEGIQCYIFSN